MLACMYVILFCESLVPMEDIRGNHITGNMEWLWAATWVLEMNSSPSVRAESLLND